MFDIFYIKNKPTEWAVQVNSIDEAKELSKTRFCWILDGRNDYSDFDLLQEPVPWEAHQMHVWPSQHQDNGGTYLIPKNNTPTDQLEVNYNSNIVKRVVVPKLVYIDHGGTPSMNGILTGAAHKTRFINDYLGTLKRVIKKVQDEEYVWVTSSVCSYFGFDFTWHPSEFQKDMLHVFPSDEQKFGDTFYIHVESFLEKVKNLELLEWYDTICFQDIKVPRLPPEIFLHSYDNQPEAVASVLFNKIEDPDRFNDPVLMFTTTIEFDEPIEYPAINLWRPETRCITPLDRGGKSVLIPKDAYTEVLDELYDYPYIDKTHRDDIPCKPINIIFMSNGEECATANYRHLMQRTSQLPNRKIWVSDIKGRIESAREAASRSTTDWFFSVNAKLKVDIDFPWDWQPDRMQARKHYIFYAYNPHTDDTYGHMAMIAWNKELVMTDTDWGLDFTMSHAHEVIPMLSGEAVYSGEWDLWRTAFREVIKLQLDDSMDASFRLKNWLNSKDEHTAQGASDAVQYYTNVNGDMDKLKLSFEWAWLRSYFDGLK